MDGALTFIVVGLLIIGIAIFFGRFIGPNDDRY